GEMRETLACTGYFCADRHRHGATGAPCGIRTHGPRIYQPALTSSCEHWIGNLRSERLFLNQVGALNFFELERSTGSPSLFHRSIPPRRTVTCSNPSFESISAALAERFSLRQMVTIGLRLMSVSS